MTSLADTASAGLGRNSAQAPLLPAVRIWLVIIATFVLAMVVVGGATRLTGSGLSITEWKPIVGALPPMSEAAWQDAFEKYKQIPQYDIVNKGMSLEGFKAIFYWEWGHRLLGRLVGFVFLLPFGFFLWRGAIPKPFISKVFALFLLGGAQGALGWFMVSSGLVGSDRIAVSQYRLAAHLALATVIAAYAFWLALTIREEGQDRKAAPAGRGALAILLRWRGGHRAWQPHLPANHRGRVRRRAQRRIFLEHLAADERRNHPVRHGLLLAAVDEPVREPADGAVRPPADRVCHRDLRRGLRAGGLAHGPRSGLRPSRLSSPRSSRSRWAWRPWSTTCRSATR